MRGFSTVPGTIQVLTLSIAASVLLGLPSSHDGRPVPMAFAGIGPVERPLPADALPRHGLPEGVLPPLEPPAVGSAGPATVSEGGRATRETTGSPIAAREVDLRAGLTVGDTSLTVYFDATTDEWQSWWITLIDAVTGAEQRTHSLGSGDVVRCGTQLAFCRGFNAADGWMLDSKRRYKATITARRADGTEHVSKPSGERGPRTLPVPPSLPAAQAAGCACPNILGRTAGLQEVRGAHVNTGTGAFMRTEHDLRMPSYGVPFEAARTYSSANPTAGMFGVGWSWTYDMRVFDLGGGRVRVRAEDGAEAVYTDGKPPPGARSKLAKSGTGWILTTPDQRLIEFGADGRLMSVTNRRGNGVRLSYADSGLLASVTDVSGRVVSVTTDPVLRMVTGIELPDRRSVHFGYDRGRLAEARDPSGHVWRYRYDDNGRLAEVVDPRGNPEVRNRYDAAGRVVEQRNALGDATRFSYDDAKQETLTIDPDEVRATDGYRGYVLHYTRNANGDVVHRRYDGRLNQGVTVSPKGNQQETKHDANDNPAERSLSDRLNLSEQYEFDPRNNLKALRDPDNKPWTWDYSDHNELREQFDPEQIKRKTPGYTYLWNDKGLLWKRTDPLGNTSEFDYDQYGNRIAEHAASKRKTEFTYDLTGRLISVVDPRGTVIGANPDAYRTRFAYDAQDRLVERHDPGKAEPWRMAYDESGNRLWSRDPLGNTARNEYDRADQRIRALDGKGNATTYSYTPAGRSRATVDPEGNTISWTYDTQGRVRTETSPLGHVDNGRQRAAYTRTFYYDYNGNLVRAERPYPGGGKVQVDAGFDDLNRPNVQHDQLNAKTQLKHSGTGNVSDIIDERGRSVAFTYDDSGRRSGAADGNRPTAKVVYDNAGNPKQQTLPSGGSYWWGYDADGRAKTVKDPLERVWEYEYDLAGNPLWVAEPVTEARTYYTYDANNRLTETKDANGHITRYQYDEADRQTAVIGPDGRSTTRYAYDASGLVTQRTDPLGRIRTTDHDRAGRPTINTDPLGRKNRTSYDAESNVVRQITAGPLDDRNIDARTIKMTYDPLGRLTARQHGSDGPLYTYGYDAKNRIVSMADPEGVREHEYNETGQLTKVTRGLDTFAYAYDRKTDLLESRTYPDGTRISIGYDKDTELLSSLSANRQGNTATFGFHHDKLERIDEIHYPESTGITETRKFDPAGRLQKVSSVKSGQTVSSFELTFDAVGNPEKVQSQRSAGPGQPTITEAAAYKYDSSNRLTEACFGAQTCSGPAAERYEYAYDLVGNRLRQTKTTPALKNVIEYRYDKADQLISEETSSGTAVSRRDFDYDAEGNQIRAGTDRFTYHLDHTLATAEIGGSKTTYSYDASGLRVGAVTGTGAAQRKREWAWDVNNPLPMIATETVDGQRRSFLHGPGGEPFALLEGNQAHPYLHDWLGGVSAMVAPTGTPEWSYAYDPFGAARATDQHSPGAPANPFRFAGGYQDDSQGDRYALHARDYDPSTGRFGGTDPMPAGLDSPADSSYAYVGNRPTALTDPSGMQPDDGQTQVVIDPGVEVDDATVDQMAESARKLVSEAESFVNQIADEIVNLILELVGYNDAKKCITEGDVPSCISMVLQAVPWGKLFKAAKVMIQAVGVGKRLIEGYGKLNAARKAHERIVDLKKQRATLQNAREVFERERRIAQQSADAAKHTRSLTQNTVSNARKSIKRERQRERCETAPPIGERLDNSFVSGTQVLMADGSTKPIEQVQIGEQVLATDPVNGRTDPQIVDALITGEANKLLVELTVAGQSIVATADHPFWSVGASRWTPAGELTPETTLRTAGGTDVPISAIVPVSRPGTLIYNLSITSLRTYYVLAGNTPVLVHNEGGDDYNQAMNKALGWLRQRGFKAEKPTTGKFGSIQGKPIGMQTADGRTGFRIEFDSRNGAHINVWSGKEKGPHFAFDATEKTVAKLQGKFGCK